MIDHPLYKWIGFIVSWLLLPLPVLGGEAREQLVARARDGNRAAILSIRSMECRYERVPWAGTTLEQANKHFALYRPGEFWSSGDSYRLVKPHYDGVTDEYVVRDGMGFFLRSGASLRNPILSFQSLRPVDGVGGEIWEWLLFSHWAQTLVSFHPFHEILARPHSIHKAELLPAPANEIYVKLAHANGQLEFWFDPRVNYLIRKSVMVPAAGTAVRWENAVVEFAEPAPSVFVPTIIEHRNLVDGSLKAVLRTILSEVKLNQPMGKNALRLPGIDGMECIDNDRDVKFKVDADGNRIGPESPVRIARISPPSTTGSPPLSSVIHPLPGRPPTPMWVWVLVVSVLVLLSGGILAVLRRRKRAM